MAIECENCQGTDFQIQDGATFCVICGTESQEHGQETVVDDETMGAFTDHAGSLKRKALSDSTSRRRRKRAGSRCKVGFKSIHVFSFILKGWTQDAINDLGVDESVAELALNLWAKYLSVIGMAFVKPGQIPSLGIEPNFRDLQVSITGRKRLITPQEITHFLKGNESRYNASKKGGDDEFDYFSEESTETRRKRSKAKRKFLNSFASDTSNMADDSSTSFLTTSDDGSKSNSDISETSDSEDDRPDIVEVHKEILSRLLTVSKQRDGRNLNNANKPDKLRLKVLYAIFCYAVLLMENNTLTLSDLLRYAKNGAIAYSTGAQHVPPVMKLQMNHDVNKFTGMREIQRKLEHLPMRRLMNRLGELIQLKEINLGGTETSTVQSVVKRYLKEFALPKTLAKMLFNSLRHSGLFELKWKFKPYIRDIGVSGERNAEPISSSDLRAIALILFALKYLYGLDDETETKQMSSGSDDFNVMDWISWSKHRVFLACRFSADLHFKLRRLFPYQVVKLTRPAHHVAMKERRMMFSEFRNYTNFAETNNWGKSDRRFYTGQLRSLNNVVKCFKVKPLKKKFEKAKINRFYCKTSTTPLHKFADYYARQSNLESNEERPSVYAIQRLKCLLDLHKSKVNLKKADPEAEFIDVKASSIVISNLPQTCNTNRGINEEYDEKDVFTTQQVNDVFSHRKVNFKPIYWRYGYGRENGVNANRVKRHTDEYNSRLLSTFPENFSWILQYFSAILDVKPSEIYNELLLVEWKLYEYDHGYFGKLFRAKMGL